ncbi:reduced viability upon starvation protein 161 [Pyricularia oryzae Y34]|uniref:Reduced viability upon starvation protein 161 n=1 Tax=Pyricularia oryzae (strain Y34) TaxID=1143189 RepID=A0AA97PJ82_PYRO3|nr:reduced viability upon starvation protein 161 [Pyricularia oryzae Y34]
MSFIDAWPGHVEKTNDRDYEVEERRFRTMEAASNRLQKEAKGYLDSLRAMTASQMRIAETIDAFYGDSGAKDGVSRSYKQAVEDLDAETIKALDGPYRTTVLEPITRFCNYFPDVNEFAADGEGDGHVEGSLRATQRAVVH